MSEGIAALLGAIIGGGLVVLGDFLARRSDHHRSVRREVRERAATLVSFEWHREVMAESVRRGTSELDLHELKVFQDRERRVAASNIFVSPIANQLMEPMIQLMKDTNDKVAAVEGSEQEWLAAREAYKNSRDRFEEAVRRL